MRGNTSSSQETSHGTWSTRASREHRTYREWLPKNIKTYRSSVVSNLNAMFGAHYNHSLNAHKKISSQRNEEYEMRRAVSRATENAGSVSTTLLCFLRIRACGRLSYSDIDAAVLLIH